MKRKVKARHRPTYTSDASGALLCPHCRSCLVAARQGSAARVVVCTKLGCAFRPVLAQALANRIFHDRGNLTPPLALALYRRWPDDIHYGVRLLRTSKQARGSVASRIYWIRPASSVSPYDRGIIDGCLIGPHLLYVGREQPAGAATAVTLGRQRSTMRPRDERFQTPASAAVLLNNTGKPWPRAKHVEFGYTEMVFRCPKCQGAVERGKDLNKFGTEWSFRCLRADCRGALRVDTQPIRQLRESEPEWVRSQGVR